MAEQIQVEVSYRNTPLFSEPLLLESCGEGRCFLHTSAPMPIGSLLELHAGESHVTAQVVDVVEQRRKMRGLESQMPGMTVALEGDFDGLVASAAAVAEARARAEVAQARTAAQQPLHEAERRVEAAVMAALLLEQGPGGPDQALAMAEAAREEREQATVAQAAREEDPAAAEHATGATGDAAETPQQQAAAEAHGEPAQDLEPDPTVLHLVAAPPPQGEVVDGGSFDPGGDEADPFDEDDDPSDEGTLDNGEPLAGDGEAESRKKKKRRRRKKR